MSIKVHLQHFTRVAVRGDKVAKVTFRGKTICKVVFWEILVLVRFTKKPAQLVFDIVQTSEFVFCNVSKNVLGRMLLLFYEVPILKLSFKLEGGGGG